MLRSYFLLQSSVIQWAGLSFLPRLILLHSWNDHVHTYVLLSGYVYTCIQISETRILLLKLLRCRNGKTETREVHVQFRGWEEIHSSVYPLLHSIRFTKDMFSTCIHMYIRTYVTYMYTCTIITYVCTSMLTQLYRPLFTPGSTYSPPTGSIHPLVL